MCIIHLYDTTIIIIIFIIIIIIINIIYLRVFHTSSNWWPSLRSEG